MSDTVIKVENVGKRYRIRHERPERYRTLRDTITRGTQRLLKPQAAAPSTDEDFWALKDVSFEIKQGEVVGIIGRNGAGKSTLLKILSRITEPTKGRITLRGRVASLLEVGTGFHPELTGRENIYLNGAILGMNKTEIRRKFDEIVAFAEVEKFLDTAVKHYSSGMYVRLAFAVAAHLEPEILIIDEVLAVGDAAFQKKCLGAVGEATQQGRTALFVSHNMGVVSSLCRSAFLLDKGAITQAGETMGVIRSYLDSSTPSADSHSAFQQISDAQHDAAWGGTTRMRLRSVRLLNNTFSTFTVHWKERIKLELEIEAKVSAENVLISFAVFTLEGTGVLGTHSNDGHKPLFTFEAGTYRIVTEHENPLRAGKYVVVIGADTALGNVPLFRVAGAVSLEVLDVSAEGDPYPQYGGVLVNGSGVWSQPVRYGDDMKN